MKTKSTNKPEIKPLNQVGDYRTGCIDGLSASQIQQKLGFASNCSDDPDKVKYSWGFTVNGVRCAVWDYKGSHTLNTFSAFGPAESLKLVFGDNYVG